MTREQVFEVEKMAKVYLDFGYFPGPERIPREAAALYCNIITSQKGAAANDKDVKISGEFKFSLTDDNLEKIAVLAVDMIINYDAYVSRFDDYRKVVYNQISSFEDTIYTIFGGADY